MRCEKFVISKAIWTLTPGKGWCARFFVKWGTFLKYFVKKNFRKLLCKKYWPDPDVSKIG